MENSDGGFDLRRQPRQAQDSGKGGGFHIMT